MQMRSLRPGFKNRFFVTAAVTALLVSGFDPAFASNRELTSDELNLPAILLPNGTKVPDSLNDPDLWIECIDRMRGSRLPEEFREVARFFKEEGERLGVFWPGVLVQSMHETNYYKYGGDARKESWNVGGVGITKDVATTTHQDFGNLRRGVRAMLEHVAVYADPDRMKRVITEQNYVELGSNRFLADRTQQHFDTIRKKYDSFHAYATEHNDPNRPVRFNDLGAFRKEEDLNKLRGTEKGQIPPDLFDKYKSTRASIGGATLTYAGDPFYGAKWYLKWKQASSCVQNKYPRKVILPNFRGEPLKKSKEWLEKHRLTVKLNPGVPAPTENKSGTIQEQAPRPGKEVKPGDTVTLTVHSKYVSVDLREVVVPDLRGLSYPDAKEKLEALGLTIVWRDGGRPNLRPLANTFQRQDPLKDTRVSKGETVYAWYY
jgi:hypothetical protein